MGKGWVLGLLDESLSSKPSGYRNSRVPYLIYARRYFQVYHFLDLQLCLPSQNSPLPEANFCSGPKVDKYLHPQRNKGQCFIKRNIWCPLKVTCLFAWERLSRYTLRGRISSKFGKYDHMHSILEFFILLKAICLLLSWCTQSWQQCCSMEIGSKQVSILLPKTLFLLTDSPLRDFSSDSWAPSVPNLHPIFNQSKRETPRA